MIGYTREKRRESGHADLLRGPWTGDLPRTVYTVRFTLAALTVLTMLTIGPIC